MNAKRMGLTRIIQLGFIGVLSLMFVNGAVSFSTSNSLLQSTSWVTHTYEVKGALEKLLRNLIDAETGQRGFLYANDPAFLDPYNNALKSIPDSVAAVMSLIKDNPEQIQRLKAIDELSRQKTTELAKTIELYKAGQKDEARQIVTSGTGKKLMDDIRTQINEMNHLENSLLELRNKEADTVQSFSSISIVGGTCLSIAIGLFVLWLINRNFLRPINEVINIVSSVSTEIATTVNQHERTASQQATAANETSATIEELSISSRKSAEQASNAAAMTEKAGSATSQGDQATRQAVTSMANLNEKIGTMAKQILHLGEQTGQIGGIATVLKDLASQINMLALNAAVEAARAGEHGKGFAVVASEIRKLADESKKSAEQTALLVADIQKATNSSIMMTEEGTRTVNEVTETVQKVAELFTNLAALAATANENVQQVMLNSKQQSAAFNQVAEATTSIATGVKETAAGISQTKLGIQNMNQAAENLKAIV